MGLELLARSAVSKISPTLLAEPDREQQNLLHALNLGSAKTQKKSLATNQVLSLCQILIKDFTETEYKIAFAIINRRNEELHSGTAAFGEYPTQQWISGFYKCCKILCEFQDETLQSLLGEEIKMEAEIILAEVEEEIIGKTKALIAAHKKVFENKDETDKNRLKEEAIKAGDRLAIRGHHRVECPACNIIATVNGEPFGRETIEHHDNEIIVRQSMLPTKFVCNTCELKLTGYNALSAAGIGNHYTRRTSYTPEQYYEMKNPDDYNAIAERYSELHPPEEWNNE